MELIPSVEWEGMAGDELLKNELWFEASGREVWGARALSPAFVTLRL